MELAQTNRSSEGEAIAVAEVWFDAGKDFDHCDQESLATHLSTHFGWRW
jgi:hypothetical protein